MQETLTSINEFEQCTKCTSCTVACPVLAANPSYPGPKQAGPDGERYRLKNPHFYDEALKMCMNCKRCEVACPSGVKIGDIIQSAKIKHGKRSHVLRDTMLAGTDLMGPVATTFAPVVNASLKLAPVKALLDVTIGVDRHRTMPKYSSRTFESWFRKNAAA
ncbi:MAG: 4Fe-4S dicluster domain-containing protein, partial [Bacteroidales bacterium]|nr:4Fe-4S dicluster domain-containing protein [Bacteroidales bacterium]